MTLNPINNSNKQSFLPSPLKIFQSLAWVGLAILALPTMIGSYLALKKAIAIWSKNENASTIKTDQAFANTIAEEEDFDIVSEAALTKEDSLKQAKDLYKQKVQRAVDQFRAPGCLKSESAEVYCDLLKEAEKNHLGFYFNIDLLHKGDPPLNEFLQRVQGEIKEAEKGKSSLVFVPFLLAGNIVHREQHIVVAVINIAKQQIEYFDPKGNYFYSWLGALVDRNVAQGGWNISTQNFLERLSQTAFPDKQSTIIRNMNGPQSLGNRVDCGAYALDFIQRRLYADFLQSEHPNYFKTSLSSDAKQLRKEMAATLEARLATTE